MRYNKDTCLKIPVIKQELESAPSLVYISPISKNMNMQNRELFFSTTCTLSQPKKKKMK